MHQTDKFQVKAVDLHYTSYAGTQRFFARLPVFVRTDNSVFGHYVPSSLAQDDFYSMSKTKRSCNMLILKHLKALQHVSIIIQIIIREFVSSLLKSLNLKFKNAVQHTSPHRTLRTYTKRYAAASPHLTFYIFKF